MKTLLVTLLFFANVATPPPSYVYICTGPGAHRYHKTDDCRGLGSCSGEIKKVTVSEAIKMDRTPCRICKP